MWFFQIESFYFISFLFWGMLYALLFSAYMIKLIIFRYVQPRAFEGNVIQTGSPEVRLIFPSISTLKDEYNAAMVDFGLNLVVGIIFGGTRVGMDLG